ncbi:G-type lectin S-receptor-like serine/threonine-protein kinase At1g34300 isoform X1 [Phragmites australis]|uniref:G-type lectin S-receptor-like serine/threonine-protein kinase At1g34300 isoform X1 n=2 Tax=Phragmites australis TaxID=29695 RepID=UPI002D78A88E|nr:G-type lectin S-receptor-like serine/threonine-protein kinase At1g34300 isoform X1 [Phragmites australis]
MENADIVIATAIFVPFLAMVLLRLCIRCDACFAVRRRTATTQPYEVVPDHRIRNVTIEKFLSEIKHEKPFRFAPPQIAGFTQNYSTRLGAGGFGTVFKGELPNGLAVAVKVFHSSLDQRSEEEQFMAEVGTIGRTHHINLVRLFGFCFDDDVRALVYEYMEHGDLGACLLDQGRDVGLPALRDIAVGVARGIRYLHEECQQKIVHYDIKPVNVLLDGDLTPKVADFGLARLVNRADTHVSMSGVRGTPGFAAPELWMQSGVTEKCDVYSFGMLLLEIVGRRRNFDEAAPESQQWFPKLAWTKYESGDLMEIIATPSRDHSVLVIDDDAQQCKETVERMCKVAFWCVQQQPEARPPMGVVVKMLEGEMDIAPPANPFQHLMAAPVVANLWTTTTSSGNTVSANSNCQTCCI